MKILETERTILREVVEMDAEFILDLINQPSFIKYIGDRNIRTVEEARIYAKERMIISYEQFGFGMYLIELKKDKTPIGVCGFVKREDLPYADIGFALLPEYEGKGFALETSDAILKYGKEKLGFDKVLAITTQNNIGSMKLLEKLGFSFEKLTKSPHADEELNLFSKEL